MKFEIYKNKTLQVFDMSEKLNFSIKRGSYTEFENRALNRIFGRNS
jgi:hypothetical protein